MMKQYLYPFQNNNFADKKKCVYYLQNNCFSTAEVSGFMVSLLQKICNILYIILPHCHHPAPCASSFPPLPVFFLLLLLFLFLLLTLLARCSLENGMPCVVFTITSVSVPIGLTHLTSARESLHSHCFL